MKTLFTILYISFLSSVLLPQSVLDKVAGQLIAKDNLFQGRFPLYTENGTWVFDTKPNWFSGFTSGELWYMYEITGKEEFKKRALVHADSLIKYASLDNTHDLGFIFFNSCVRAYKHTGITKYKDAAVQAARMLVKRYNTKGNFIRAWGKLGSNDRPGLMIIDTMMNLELLFWAAKETGDYTFYDIAYQHAVTCMNQHVRKDYSSYHVVEFNPETGDVVKRRTHQGYADETTWARGQAWGIYGFALAYKYTGDERFLHISRKMTEYFLTKLPADMIACWDMDLSGPDVTKDASASAIAASGMYLLAELSKEKSLSQYYKNTALRITDSLSTVTLFTNSPRKEEGILLHTVYNYAKKFGIDESFPAGDFYFVECLRKQHALNSGTFFIKEQNERTSYSLNAEWYFLEDEINSPGQLTHSPKPWMSVTLPHTWNAADALDQEPGYRRNTGWYQKDIFIPEFSSAKKFILHFEGVNNSAAIYINGTLAGTHTGGYIGFDIDITPFIKQGEVNTLLVKADNSYNPYLIPSQKSDFLLYGGITRNVFLNILTLEHISGMLISTPKVSVKSAQTAAKVYINTQSAGDYTLDAFINDEAGKEVANFSRKVKLQPGQNEVFITMPELSRPRLWSPSNPYLYTFTTVLKSGKTQIDKISDKIGYRWFEFKERGAFYLNGERLLLRGTHRHEEYSGLGNALHDSIHRKDIQLIKEMGANFVRLAHYPQAPEVYRACDELGLLVWDENPWCRGGMGPAEWQDNTKRIFRNMILQNYNHPSIILWSIGNESDWLADFPGGDNPDSLKAFAKVLHDLAKELDPYRYTTARKFPAAQNIVDVFSPSIWSGWYSDVYKNYEKSLTKARDTYKRMFHAEFGGDSHPGRHTETPTDGEGKVTTTGGDEPVNKFRSSSIANIGDWSESYIVDLFDWYLHVTENLDWFTGSAQWIFRDFTTPLRPENPIPYVNQKGLVDMQNNPKDAYYVFKSYWSEKPDFVYIESHTWRERFGKPNELREVNVFSNCPQVELFLNGKSMGRLTKDTKKFPASGLSWKVQFTEDSNFIKAVGYGNGKTIAEDTLTVNYSTKLYDKPDNLVLTQKRNPDGSYLITATAVDKNGLYFPELNTRVYFTALSGGKLRINSGAPSASSVIEMANGKASITFDKIPFKKGIVEVRSQEYKGTYIIVETGNEND